MSENEKELKNKQGEKQHRISPELDLNALLDEISGIKIEIPSDKGENKISFREKQEEKTLKSDNLISDKNKISSETPPEPEEFNVIFDKELDDNFLCGGIEMIGKPNIPEAPDAPSFPSFPTAVDLEKLLEGRIPRVPDHFTIEIPKEFEQIIPPEPLGSPPAPPVPPDIKTS